MNQRGSSVPLSSIGGLPGNRKSEVSGLYGFWSVTPYKETISQLTSLHTLLSDVVQHKEDMYGDLDFTHDAFLRAKL
ncbi:hypothetical protein CEXT_672361 [Caerostris extrusa]|uniref:Uncharacterized protein n=1 Tax=Caerostris extrusa TaxID=172846 RepID=A0AAV4Q830_CAEEX|nr:hypothetical protein CEXT_672361 [Caerostris extrusa]